MHGEAAALATAHRAGDRRGAGFAIGGADRGLLLAVVGGGAADGGDGKAVAVRIRVIQQQVGVGAAAGADVIGHREDLVFAGAAPVVQRLRRGAGAGDGDREAGAGADPAAVGEAVADGGLAAGAGGQVVKVAVGVKTPGAVAVDNKLAAAAAAHAAGLRRANVNRDRAVAGGAAGEPGNGRAIACVRVRVVEQQVGVDATAAAVRRVRIDSAGAVIRHPQGRMGVGAARIVAADRGIVQPGDGDGEAGVGL